MSYSSTYLKSRNLREIEALADLKRGPIASGHKGFDAAVSGKQGYIGTGNVTSKNQASSYVRAHTQTLCNGRTFTPGELQQFDLDRWRSLPRSVAFAVRSEALDKNVILYAFGVSNGDRGTNIQGYAITDTFHRLLWTQTASGPKAAQVMEAVLPHISWRDDNAVDPYPVDEMLEATAHFEANTLIALAKDYGFECVAGSKEDMPTESKARFAFRETEPYMTWREDDFPASCTRGDTPAEAATLLVLRTGGDLERLKDWIAENAPAPDTEMSPM